MKTYFKNIKYFKPQEFDSPDQPGSGFGINTDLVWILDQIRKNINRPIIINSGVRTAKHNAAVNGVADSAHLSGDAVDVRVPDSSFQYWFIYYALRFGIRRFVLYKSHIHIDIDKIKPQFVFLYNVKR